MNARRTALSVILTVLAASSTLANGAEKSGRHPPRRLTGPDPPAFKIDKIYRVQGTQGVCMATADKIYVEGRSPSAMIARPTIIGRCFESTCFSHSLCPSSPRKAAGTWG